MPEVHPGVLDRFGWDDRVLALFNSLEVAGASPARVERELAAAWDSGAQPLVILTKTDLADPGTAETLAARLSGADVLATSAASGFGIDELRLRLQPCRTAVLLGPSGAGKSTLANALLGDEVLSTADVRDADRRGRHTTTSRQMVAVPGGGVLIDTPGCAASPWPVTWRSATRSRRSRRWPPAAASATARTPSSRDAP